jgi:glycolate oxidase
MTATVEPGVVLGDLQREVDKIGLFYPPDPSNLAVSTIGGSIAQNSGGAKSFKYGTTKDYVLDMKVVLADGSILKTGSNTIKNSTGYNLNSLFVGSEGTLGIVAEVTLKLIPKPEAKKVFMAYFDTVKEAVWAVNALIEQRIYPATIDFMDKNAIQTVEQFYPANLLTDKEAVLIIEIDGFECSMDYQESLIIDVLSKCHASAIQASHNNEEYENIWKARRSSMGACAKLKPNVTTDDVIVPRENLSKLILGIREICNKYNLAVCMVGHVGDGSVHPQIPIDYNDEEEYNRYKKAKAEIYDLTASLGGILSGEHGIGTEKRKFIGKVVSSVSLDCMRQIKKIFDPNNILNPYKIF